MKLFNVVATRTYYSVIERDIEAETLEEAEAKMWEMIDNCEVEFSGLEGYEDDEVEAYPIKLDD